MKCSAVKAFLPTSGIGSFENCRARCCKDGVCKDLVEDGGPPIVPYGVEPLVPEHPVPENMPVILPEHMPVSPPVRVTLPLLPPVGDQSKFLAITVLFYEIYSRVVLVAKLSTARV